MRNGCCHSGLLSHEGDHLELSPRLGFTECLSAAKGKLTPTFKNSKGGKVVHQLDRMFVTERLASEPIRCEAGTHADVFDAHLSDHLPIIANFSLPL